MKIKTLFISLILLVVGSIIAFAQPGPSQLWQDTTLLYQSWDSALDTSSYTTAEKNRQKQINERLGHEWVLSYYPIQDAQQFGDLNQTLSPQERHIDFEDITPYTWKWILLRTPEGRIHLRRPNWWLKLHQVEKGKPLGLSMPEMQLNVVGEVEQILPNLLDSRFPPAPRDGDYAWLPITAWMERMAPEVWSYVFSSEDTIKATPNHPVFSKDRERFVAIGELSFGEEVLNNGALEITLLRKNRLAEIHLVNNLEVWRGHSYSVGGNGICVHNGCLDDLLNAFHKGKATGLNDIVDTDGEILLLGEADFSFSKSLSSSLTSDQKRRITATEFDDLSTITSKHSNADDNVKFLKENGFNIKNGIDATTLSNTFKGKKFGKIIFNFPYVYVGGLPANSKATVEMLKSFLKEAEQVLVPGGEVIITSSKRWASTFNFKAIFSQTKLVLVEIKDFSTSNFPGYKHVQTSGNEVAADIANSYSFILKKL